MPQFSPELLQALQRRKAELAQGGQPQTPQVPAPQNAGIPQPPQAPQVPQGAPQGQPAGQPMPDQGAMPVDPAEEKLKALKALLMKAISHI